MADKAVLPCPNCGKVSQFSNSMSGTGQSVATCQNCHKNIKLEIKNGKIIGIRKV